MIDRRPDVDRLPRVKVPQGGILFRRGDSATGFVLVRRGRIEVRLTGHSGREILLYAVEPGQSCVQTTLGLLGDEAYTGEAIAATEVELSLIPKADFLRLMGEDAGFRADVLRAFGQRMSEVTRVLELVAFERIDQRLALALLDMAVGKTVTATQADLAARIGSAREVVTRQLHDWALRGLIRTGRGKVEILDRDSLSHIAETPSVT